MHRLILIAAIAIQTVIQSGPAGAEDATCTTQRAAAGVATQELMHYTERDDATRAEALQRVRGINKQLRAAITACEASGTAGDLLFAVKDMSRLQTSLEVASAQRLHDVKGWEKPLNLEAEEPPAPTPGLAPAPPGAAAPTEP